MARKKLLISDVRMQVLRHIQHDLSADINFILDSTEEWALTFGAFSPVEEAAIHTMIENLRSDYLA